MLPSIARTGDPVECRYVTRRSARFLSLLAGLLITMPAAITPLRAQAVQIDPATGLVSVDCNGVPLQALLEQISAVAPFDLLRLEPSIRLRPVQVSIHAASVKEAVIQILIAGGAGFAISGPQNGHGLRVVAGPDELIRTAGSPMEPAPDASARAADVDEPARVKPDDPVVEAMESEETVEPSQDRSLADERHRELVGTLNGSEFPIRRGGAVLLPFPAAGGGSVTAIAAAPGTVVELPFPGSGGAPLTAVVPQPGAPVQLPFPASPPRAPKIKPKSDSTPKIDKP